MGSVNRLDRLLAAIEARKQKSDRFLHDSVSAWEMLRTGIMRQQVYLLWTVALTVMHILEIWILIRFHYAYPPPSGLTALRIISSLSLVGLFGALSFRWADFDSQLGQHAHSSVPLRLARVFDSARIVLITGVIGSLCVGFWVLLFSQLQLSSPAAFRAVVFGGILGLPIDVTASFLLYLSANVGALPVSRRLRTVAFSGSLMALFFLALDLPLFYLFFALTPRIYLLSQVWKNISGQSLATLIFLPRHAHDISAPFRRLFSQKLFYSAATQVLFDFGFLFLFNRLSRFEAGISLLLYLVHKSAHLGMVLVGKTHLSFSSGIKSALLIGESTRLSYLLNAMALLGVYYVILGFAFTPLFLMQRQTQHWLSPTGETMNVDLVLLAIGVLLTANCILINIATTLTPYRKMRWMALASVAFILFSLTARWLCPTLVQILNVRSALVLFGAAQLIWALVMIKYSTKQILAGTDGKNSGASGMGSAPLHTLSSFLLQLPLHLKGSTAGKSGLFVVTFYRGKQWEPSEALSLLSGVTVARDLMCVWGSRTLLIFAKRENVEAIEELHLELLERLAGTIENIKYCRCNTLDPKEVVASLVQHHEPSKYLYELGANRFPAEPTDESMDVLRAIESWQVNSKDAHALESVLTRGLGAIELEGEWGLDSISSLELKINARRFLRSLFQRQEYLSPDTTNPKDFGGFIHINRAGKPRLLIHIPIDKRETFAALRYETFRLNLNDFISSLPNMGQVIN